LHGKKKGDLLVEQAVKLSENYKNDLVSALEIFPNLAANRKLIVEQPFELEQVSLPLLHADGNDEGILVLEASATKKKFELDSHAAACNFGVRYYGPGTVVCF
jgi:hypothetical protein